MKYLIFLFPLLFFTSCTGEHEYSHLIDNWSGIQQCKGFGQKYETIAVIETIPYSNDINLIIQNEYFKGTFEMEEVLYNTFRFSQYPITMELHVINNDTIHIDLNRTEAFWTTFCDIDLMRN